jgi:ABC-type metal ion transport system substrate-binding protein
MATAKSQRRIIALQLVEPGLHVCRRDDSADPRLVELVRLLARRAARKVFEEQMKGHRVPRS